MKKVVEDHIEEDYIEEDYVEKDYVKEDYIEEDRAYEKDSYVHPINDLSKKPKKKKKGGIFKVIALCINNWTIRRSYRKWKCLLYNEG